MELAPAEEASELPPLEAEEDPAAEPPTEPDGAETDREPDAVPDPPEETAGPPTGDDPTEPEVLPPAETDPEAEIDPEADPPVETDPAEPPQTAEDEPEAPAESPPLQPEPPGEPALQPEPPKEPEKESEKEPIKEPEKEVVRPEEKSETMLRAPAETAALRAGTVYSSRLEEFVTAVEIQDGDGNVISPHDTVYIGESYFISIAFSENNLSGQEKQFEYNEHGYLTYQIPAVFVCVPVDDGVLVDSGGEIVGYYTIDSDGHMNVWFIDGFIDSSKASFHIELNTTASSSGEGGVQSIDFGGYIIEVNVSSAGRLELEKTAGNYDPRTHSVEYEVEVRARNGPVRNIEYTDTPTSAGLTVDLESVVYTTLDGTPLSAPPDELASGEGFRVRYRARLDPSLYQNKNHVSYTAKNTARVTGTNDEGTVEAADSAEKRISTYFLRKTGGDDPLNRRIHWTVYVGDGSTCVDGLTLTDLPGEGLSFDTERGIEVTPYTWSGDTLQKGTAFYIPFGADPTQITLPEGMDAYRYVLSYFTGYTLDPGEDARTFSNKVSTSDPLHGPVEATGTATGHTVGVPPAVTKQVERSADGAMLHYAIDI